MLILSDSSPKSFADRRPIEDALRKCHGQGRENTKLDEKIGRVHEIFTREMKKDREERRRKTRKRRDPAGRRRRGGQGRTVNFRYGTPRKAGSGRRDKKASPQVAAPEDDSFLLPSSCPTPPLSLRLPFGQERPGKLCEERRRLSSPTKVSLKIRETLRSATLKRKRVLGSKDPPSPRSLRRRWRLCSSAAPRSVIADARPREILPGVNTA